MGRRITLPIVKSRFMARVQKLLGPRFMVRAVVVQKPRPYDAASQSSQVNRRLQSYTEIHP